MTEREALADSLLAPLIIDTATPAASAPFGASPIRTYLNIKFKGESQFNLLGTPQDKVHYVWIRKGASIAALSNLNQPCTMINNEGHTTRNDMIFQQTRGVAVQGGSTANNVLPDGSSMPVAIERSLPNTHGNNDFVGMLVITDEANESKAGSTAPEGDMSGFAYIVNGVGDVVEYKLLNNHHSAEDGDFDAGFISKKVVDFAWMENGVNPLTGVRTNWIAMVTGSDMAKHAGAFNSSYDATVLFSQKIHPDNSQSDPTKFTNGSAGVFDNDEGFTSYDPGFRVTCMGMFNKKLLLGNDPLLLSITDRGGWMRMSIAPSERIANLGAGDQFVSTNHSASGAIIYRDDYINGHHVLQVETSGHLAKTASHANRPN